MSITSSSSNNKLRVLICYPYFAHYRLPIFRELGNSRVAEFRYTSDTKTNVDGLELIGPDTMITAKHRFSELHEPVRNHWFMNRFLWQSGLLRQIWRGDFDVLVMLGNMYYVSSWCAALLARLRGKRVMTWGHGFTRDTMSLPERVRALFHRLFHSQMLYGNRAREIMIRHGLHPRSLYVIYNSLDLPAQRVALDDLKASGEYQRLLSLDIDTIKLIFVGRLTTHKRLDLLIDAVAALSRRGRKVRCKLIGEGAVEDALKQRCKALGLTREVLFAGAKYGERELSKEIVGNDLCIIPGKIGLTCIHAMAYGVPVITNNDLHGQNPEVEAIVPGVTGAFFLRDDPEDLAEQIITWIDRRVDREITASACKKVVEDYYSPQSQRLRIEEAVTGSQGK